jgi:hypothetical protein
VIAIRELLSRISHDKRFARGEFLIGYYDRREDRIIRIPLRKILFKPDDHFSFDLIDTNGVMHSLSMHLIREVQQDGKLIWHSEHGER